MDRLAATAKGDLWFWDCLLGSRPQAIQCGPVGNWVAWNAGAALPRPYFRRVQTPFGQGAENSIRMALCAQWVPGAEKSAEQIISSSHGRHRMRFWRLQGY